MSETGNSSGNTTVIENVEFRATAPSVPLPGLDNAQRKLEALGAALKRVQSQLAGLSTRTMFKLSAKQYEDVAENLLASKGMRGLGVGNIARKLGFGPEAAKDVRATADQMIAEVHKAIAKIEREIKNNPKLKARAIENRRQQIRQLYAWLPFEGPRGGEFRDPKQAGMFFGGGLLDRKLPLPKGFHFSEAIRDVLAKGYAGAALANHERGEAELRAILRGASPAGPLTPAPAANLQQAVNQAVKQSSQAAQATKQATAAVQQVKANIQQTANEATKVATETKKAAKKGAAKGTTEEPVAVDESGGLVEEKRTTYPGTDTPEKVVRTRRTGFGKTVTTTKQGESTSQMERTKVQERLAKGFDQSLNALANEYARHLHIFDPSTARRVALSQAGAYYKSRPEYAQLGFRDRMAKFKGQLDEKLAAHQQWQLAQEARSDQSRRSVRIGRSEDEERADLAMADYKQNQAAAGLRTQLTPEDREKARIVKKANQALQRQLSRWDKQAGLDDLEVLEQKRRLNRKQDVEAHEQALVSRGARLIKEDRDLLTNQVMSRRYAFDEGGYGYVARMDYDGTGGATARLKKGASTRVPQTRLQNAIEGLSGENMLANLIKVSSWSAAVMVLYKSAELANYSLKRLEQTGLEMAHLDVVFRKVGGTSQELTMDIIKLAAAQGRQTSEAMESAVAWARLGGDRKEINEEVRVSAVAANIANMHMGETTKQLQSLMHIYHLEANDLDGTLSGLVNTTLKYNVTLEEMFTGLDRSAAAAKVAGVSLAELQGMLGVLVGATGQTGATTGNALKYIFQELNKSDVQQQLREKFHVEALGNNLEQKPAGQILGELSGIWGTLGTGERGSRSQQALAGLLGGRFNAARVPIVIQEYPQVLKLAIDEQLSLNSAQEANARILDTLKANVAGLHAEYDRLLMSTSLLSKGSFTAAFAKNVMHDIASPREAYPWAGWMADHYPFMEKWGPQPYRGMNDRQRIEAFLNQGSGIGRFYDSALVSLGTLTGRNLPWSPFKTSTPGLFEIFNYAHDADVLPGQADFAKRMDDLKRRANAGALQGQAMGIAQRKLENGSMTQHDANAFAAIMRGMPGGDAAAADFLNTWQSNQPAAMALVKGMGAKAFQAKEDITTRRGDELKQNQTNMEAERDALEKKPSRTAEEEKRVNDLSQALEKNKQDLDENTAAWEELQGSVENVQITQQKYLNLLKTQEELQAGIERSFKLVQAHSPAQELAQDIGALTAQVAAARKAIDDFDESEGGIAKMEPEAASARGKLVEHWKSLQADLAGAQARQPQAEMLTAMQRGIFGAELGQRAAGFGYTEADKLLNQRAELTKDIARTEEQLAATQGNELQHAELQGRLAKDNMLLYENQLALRQRAADVEKEIAQLAIDQNREFARSFFGSGPAEMLRKLAAFRVASQGGVSMGQLFMMSPGMRQDIGQLTGMNPDMMRLLMERGQLPGFAEGGYTGSGDPNEIAGVVHKGEYVLSQEDLFNLHHDNLYPPGSPLLPNGGVYRPQGIPLDDFGHGMTPMRIPTQEKWLPAWSPGDAARQAAAHERSLPAWEPGRGTTTAPWSPRGTSFNAAVANAAGDGLKPGLQTWAQRGWTAARGFMSHPASWAGVGMNLAHGVAGAGVTGGLNWLGGKLNPALRHSDTYGGSAFGLFSDAAGGAVAGARGGPLGAGIGAVSGMVLGDAARIYGNLRDIHRATVGDDAMHQQVSAHHSALLQAQIDNPKVGGDFERQMAARREAAARSQQAFDAHMAAQGQHIAASEAQQGSTESLLAGLKAQREGWAKPKPGPIMGSNGKPAAINPATGLPYDSGKTHSLEGRPSGTTGPRTTRPQTQTGTNGNHGTHATMPTMHMPTSSPPPVGGNQSNGGDDMAVRSAAAALDALAAASGRLQAAFEGLAGRVDTLFRQTPSLNFTPSGQQGGWYPGRQS